MWPLLFGRLSSDQMVLISGAAHPDNRLCCWDAMTGESVWGLQDGELRYGCFDLSVIKAHDGRDVLAVSTEVGVQRWEARSGIRLEDTSDLTLGTIWGLDSIVAADGSPILVGAGNDHMVYRWDPISGTTAGTPLAGHRSSVKCVAVGDVPARGVLIASGSDDGTVRRWDGATGECVGVSDVINAEILDMNLLVSRSGVSVLTCGDSDGVLHRWDAVTGERLGNPIETGEMVGSLTSVDVADEPRIVAPSASGLVRQWHAVTGRLIDESHTGMSVAAVVLPDGRALLASGTEDGDISIRLA
ncbi:WD40 repeat domain-containing protein [Streptomyces doebereineriae]|uniref:WD40 repeat domain-containing protein n=1 Tax=Streptomyces doebereineriae TaxID=3075528 RepID=A0ABU2VNE1_9ACTN|nr:WD40 repeat domain-containing protein [Streptomyces sp. DSM 41640]MDT0487128.1 WD40 repeat domain-containing protein [Streptomyces sp. DSM 41640]